MVESNINNEGENNDNKDINIVESNNNNIEENKDINTEEKNNNNDNKEINQEENNNEHNDDIKNINTEENNNNDINNDKNEIKEENNNDENKEINKEESNINNQNENKDINTEEIKKSIENNENDNINTNNVESNKNNENNDNKSQNQSNILDIKNNSQSLKESKISQIEQLPQKVSSKIQIPSNIKYIPPNPRISIKKSMVNSSFTQLGKIPKAMPVYYFIKKGKGITRTEEQTIIFCAMTIYQDDIKPLSNNTAKYIKERLGGDWLVIVHPEEKSTDFHLTFLTGNDYMHFTLDTTSYQIARLR